MEKRKTYINELDEALQGGIPANHLVLLSGSPGTGKTTLGMEFAVNGLVNEEEGALLFTMTESEVKVKENLKEFSFYNEEHFAEGRITIIDLRTIQIHNEGEFSSYNPKMVLDFIAEQIDHFNAKRIIIDSITAICKRINDYNVIRSFLYELGNLLSVKDCIAVLISEVPKGESKYSNYDVEEFISDGIIHLDYMEKNNRLIKTLQIIKMRGTNHSQEKFMVNIEKEGVKLLPLLDHQ